MNGTILKSQWLVKRCKSPRLDNDRNLTLIEVLRAATINAAQALDMDRQIGSLEVGKFADFIVLDRNLFEIGRRCWKCQGIVYDHCGETHNLAE